MGKKPPHLTEKQSQRNASNDNRNQEEDETKTKPTGGISSIQPWNTIAELYHADNGEDRCGNLTVSALSTVMGGGNVNGNNHYPLVMMKQDGTVLTMTTHNNSNKWSTVYRFRQNRIGCALVGFVDGSNKLWGVVLGGGPSCETVFSSCFLLDLTTEGGTNITRTRRTVEEGNDEESEEESDDEEDDENTNIAVPLPDMREERTGVGATVVSVDDRTYLVVVGGENQHMEELDTMEVMDLANQTWIRFDWPRLCVPRNNLTVTSDGGSVLLAVGGEYDSYKGLDSVEVLDIGPVIRKAIHHNNCNITTTTTTTTTNSTTVSSFSWELLPVKMSVPRTWCGAAAISISPGLGDHSASLSSTNNGVSPHHFVLVVAGGGRGNRTVEAYHSVTQTWSPLPRLLEEYHVLDGERKVRALDSQQLALWNHHPQYGTCVVATGGQIVQIMAIQDMFHLSNENVVGLIYNHHEKSEKNHEDTQIKKRRCL